jgi:hypothetical protein
MEFLILYKLEDKFNVISNLYLNIFVMWVIIFAIIIFNTLTVFLFNLLYLKKIVLKKYFNNLNEENNLNVSTKKEKRFKLKRKSIKT